MWLLCEQRTYKAHTDSYIPYTKTLEMQLSDTLRMYRDVQRTCEAYTNTYFGECRVIGIVYVLRTKYITGAHNRSTSS